MFNIYDYLKNVDSEMEKVDKRIQLLSSISETRTSIINCVTFFLTKTEKDCEIHSIDPRVIDYLQNTLKAVQSVDAKKDTQNKLISYHANLGFIQNTLKKTVENYELLSKLLKELNSPNS